MNHKRPLNMIRIDHVKLLLVILLMCSALYGQEDNIRFKRISIEQGLSEVSVNCILHDKKKFMWFGTQDGLNRYDGYEFKIFKNIPNKSETISDNFILALFEDDDGKIWIGTDNGGLSIFDPLKNNFSLYPLDIERELNHNGIRCIFKDHEKCLWIGTYGSGLYRIIRKFNCKDSIMHYSMKNNENSINSDFITSICELRDDLLAIGTRGGGLNIFNLTNNTFVHLRHLDNENSLCNNNINIIYKDSSNYLWIGTDDGLDLYNYEKNLFIDYDKKEKQLIHNKVKSIFEDQQKRLWIGTEVGLNLLDRANSKFLYFKYDDADMHSLIHNDVLSIVEDDSGILWIGTGGGISLYYPRTEQFKMYRKKADKSNSLIYNDIWAICEDRYGDFWIGTFGKGVDQYNRKDNKFKNYSTNDLTLNNNDVRAIFEDESGEIWIGTYGGGILKLDRKNKRFISFKDLINTNSMIDNYVMCIHEDSERILWIGTYYGGLYEIDQNRKTVTNYYHKKNGKNKNETLNHNIVRTIFKDSHGTIWIGTNGGLNKFSRETKKFFSYHHNDLSPNSLSHNRVRCIHEDKNKTLWIGTLGGGLNKMFDSNAGVFKSYNEKDGLPNNIIYAIVEDDTGALWLSTNKGISKFDPKNDQFSNFDEDDGLQSNEFNAGAYYRNNKTGEIFFGGINGFNSFFPKDISADKYIPSVVITGFLISNKYVGPGNNDYISLLKKPIVETKFIKLSYQNNFFSFEFAALHYASPMKNRYQYKMEGFDKEWIETDAKNRRATYTNLPAGDYVFKVKGSNKDGIWNKKETSIKIRILPPWWATWWAYTFYIFIIMLLISWGIWLHFKKLNIEHSLNEQLKRNDKIKDEFLSNTSHELRTPLNGIIGIAESLLNGATGPLSPETKDNLSMIYSSGKRLAYLVNDILDFASLKNNNLKLQKKTVDLRTLTDIVIRITSPLRYMKKIELKNNIGTDFPFVDADENRLQQILCNLIGNAIKFTEIGTVQIDVITKDFMAYVTVSDTGIGIPEDKYEFIFQGFSQIESSATRTHEGTGIGLSITKKLVELHGGKIFVDSQVGQWSKFTFSIPLSDKLIAKQSIYEANAKFIPLDECLLEFSVYREQKNIEDNPKTGEYHILVVDDDPLNRRVVRNIFHLEKIDVTEASSGDEALRIIKNDSSIDLVLLDIMMPRLSGYDVCKKIREQWSSIELPILFLTAKGQETDMVQAFSIRANDFITKPIVKGELLARVYNCLHLKNTQHQLFQSFNMASIATLTAGLSDRLNNFTSPMKISAYNLNRDLKRFIDFFFNAAANDVDKDRCDLVNKQFEILLIHTKIIDEEINKITSILKMLNIYSSQNQDQMQRSKLLEYLKNSINLVKLSYIDQVDFITNFQADYEILCLPEEFEQVFRYILMNACQAIKEKQKKSMNISKGTLTIKTLVENNRFVINFQDTGVGMTDEVKRRAFDLFFTTRPEGEGTGLGLYISYSILRKYGGKINLNSKLGLGTLIEICLPLERNEIAISNKEL